MRNISGILIVVLSLLVLGCESNNSFRTSAGVKSDLQGTWQWVPIPRQQLPQLWKFENGTLTITSYKDYDYTNVLEVQTGKYSIKTTVTTPYIFVEGTAYEGKWLVIRLDKKVLMMDKTATGTNALMQKEFIKR
jgi:hypothetical protein